MELMIAVRTCRICGCTDDDCSKCIERTGQPCHWVEEELCSACEYPKDELDEFETTHKLDFWYGDYRSEALEAVELLTSLGLVQDDDPYDIPWMLFYVGTCHGLWRAVPDAYEILMVMNSVRGNGHLDDVFEWFEHCCRRDGKALRLRDFLNDRFKQHCLKKRGFTPDGTEHVIKHFGVGEVQDEAN